MDRTKVVRRSINGNTRKGIIISIRISKDISDFMAKNKYSPSLIFYEALKDLGFQEKV